MIYFKDWPAFLRYKTRESPIIFLREYVTVAASSLAANSSGYEGRERFPLFTCILSAFCRRNFSRAMQLHASSLQLFPRRINSSYRKLSVNLKVPVEHVIQGRTHAREMRIQRMPLARMFYGALKLDVYFMTFSPCTPSLSYMGIYLRIYLDMQRADAHRR